MSARTVAGSLAILLIASLGVRSQEPTSSDAPQRIRVLIVNGQNNHDWVTTTASLSATLSMCGRFTVDVSSSPGPKDPEPFWDAWRPEFSRYGAVVVDYNGQPWPEAVKTEFVDYVRGGGGVVFVHAANNAFPGWTEYEALCGLLWRPASYGARLTMDANGQVIRTAVDQGPGAGHGAQHPFLITERVREHPILRDFPPAWMHAKDELYHGQRGPARDLRILSTAHSAKATGGTDAHEPITWEIPYGKGRAITTVLGHHWPGQSDLEALHCVGFQTLLARATEYSATGTVTIRLPEEFPTAEAVSIRPPRDVRW